MERLQIRMGRSLAGTSVALASSCSRCFVIGVNRVRSSGLLVQLGFRSVSQSVVEACVELFRDVAVSTLPEWVCVSCLILPEHLVFVSHICSLKFVIILLGTLSLPCLLLSDIWHHVVHEPVEVKYYCRRHYPVVVVRWTKLSCAEAEYDSRQHYPVFLVHRTNLERYLPWVEF